MPPEGHRYGVPNPFRYIKKRRNPPADTTNGFIAEDHTNGAGPESNLEPSAEELLPGSKRYEKAVFIGNLSFSSRPSFVLMARTTEDVAKAVRDARAKGMPLTVRCGGHSYGGYCLNEGGVMIDLSRMNEVLVDRDEMTAKVQGGAIWKNVYDQLRDHNADLMIVGGQCPTVGVGGFTLGAGLSTFSRSFGLGIDNVLALTVVTAKGETLHLTQSETDPSRKDLFWALLGSGGGNFGIVTDFKFCVHRLRSDKVVAGELTWSIGNDAPAEQAFVSAMNAFNALDKPDYLCMDAFWSYKAGDPTKLQAQMTVIYNGPLEECEQVLKPVLAFCSDNGLKEMHWHEWEKHELTFFSFQKVFQRHISVILKDDAVTEQVTKTILELMKQAPTLSPGDRAGEPNRNECRIVWDHIGGATSRVDREATSFPWRDGAYVIDAMVQWGEAGQTEEALAWTKRCRASLAPFSIDGRAAYVNYIDPGLEDWRYAYYGENYERLRRIKREWDPTNFFSYKQSIEPAGAGEPVDSAVPLVWQNWGKTQTAYPTAICKPHSVQEVASILQEADAKRMRVRCVGSGHSWSPLVPTDGILLSMENFKAIEMHQDGKHVIVEAGVTLDELSAFFKAHEIALPSNAGFGVGEVNYGGLVSTGCHGSGLRCLSVSDYAVGFIVYTSTGTRCSFDGTAATGGEDLLNAVRISLGLFGVIVSITLAVVPAFNVLVEEWKQPLPEAMLEVNRFVTENEYAEISWMPFNDSLWMQRANRTTSPATRTGFSPPKSKFRLELESAATVTALNALQMHPEQTPDILQEGFAMMQTYTYVSNITDYVHCADYWAILADRVVDVELAVPVVGDDFSVVKKAIDLCKSEVDSWSRAGHFPFNGTLGFRFIENSNALLSPAWGNQRTVLIEMSNYYRTDLFEEFARRLFGKYVHAFPGARPHWAKGFQYLPDYVETVRQLFGQQLKEFWRLRDEAGTDPHKMFANGDLLEIFTGSAKRPDAPLFRGGVTLEDG